MMSCTEQVNIREFNKAGVAMGTATKSQAHGGRIADTLCMHEIERSVRWLANDRLTKAVENEACFDAIVLGALVVMVMY
jgi:hypothetical protein